MTVIHCLEDEEMLASGIVIKNGWNQVLNSTRSKIKEPLYRSKQFGSKGTCVRRILKRKLHKKNKSIILF